MGSGGSGSPKLKTRSLILHNGSSGSLLHTFIPQDFTLPYNRNVKKDSFCHNSKKITQWGRCFQRFAHALLSFTLCWAIKVKAQSPAPSPLAIQSAGFSMLYDLNRWLPLASSASDLDCCHSLAHFSASNPCDVGVIRTWFMEKGGWSAKLCISSTCGLAYLLCSVYDNDVT